jgi:aerobic-type carbon monoxide dehydrogenase small subunit (CoxS/CutS family)
LWATCRQDCDLGVSVRVRFEVNGASHVIEADPQMPLLWILREKLQLTGTKFGCGVGLCGACMVHLDGAAVPSCTITADALQDRQVTTIEGLSRARTHPVQRAWIEEQVPQCGYCQPGMIMAVAALLERTQKPSDADIDAALAGNICRCGTYPRIRRAIHRTVEGK